MMILWNAVVLHAKVSGMASTRLFMAMVVFGNVITGFSWFGVNMLGVGLHTYGFMEGAFLNLSLFILSQLVIIGLAFVPKRAL